MIYNIKADTQLKQGILDPEGSTIKKTLVQMGDVLVELGNLPQATEYFQRAGHSLA